MPEVEVVVVHEVDCSAFLLDDVLLEVHEVLELLVPLEAVLEVAGAGSGAACCFTIGGRYRRA